VRLLEPQRSGKTDHRLERSLHETDSDVLIQERPVGADHLSIAVSLSAYNRQNSSGGAIVFGCGGRITVGLRSSLRSPCACADTPHSTAVTMIRPRREAARSMVIPPIPWRRIARA